MVTYPLMALYGCVGALMAWECLKPAHPSPPDFRWIGRSLLLNAFNLLAFVVIGQMWTSHAVVSLLQLDGKVPPFAGALLAYFIFTFVVYWWHRLRHSSSFFWRWFHQIHHSPRRIELLTAYYIHPFDLLANLCISNVIVYAVLGLDIHAAAWYTFITGLAGFVIHANIRLPRALGYVFQTPEMHRLHHEYNHHASNYSDIVWWDMLFGTYENPKRDIERCGFDGNLESQWLSMLFARDLNQQSERNQQNEYNQQGNSP